MFNGTGTTCIAAKQLGRRYIGIDVNKEYNDYAKQLLNTTVDGKPDIFLQRPMVRKPVGSTEQLKLSLDYEYYTDYPIINNIDYE